MSSGIPRLRAEVEPIANDLLTRILAGVPDSNEPSCSAGMVCGSIRRRADMVGDIELVLLPHWIGPAVQTDLFGGAPKTTGERQCPILDRTLQHLTRSDWLSRDERCCWGQRQRRLRLGAAAGDLEGFTVELYLADGDNFGNIVVLRTGDEEFTKPIFSPMYKGGFLPKSLVHEGGYLWLALPGGRREKISCPTEDEFFKRIKVDWIEPEQRSVAIITRLRDELRIPWSQPAAAAR